MVEDNSLCEWGFFDAYLNPFQMSEKAADVIIAATGRRTNFLVVQTEDQWEMMGAY